MKVKDKTLDKWPEIKARIKRKWAKLPEKDLDNISGTSDELEALLEKHYGMSTEDARRELRIISREYGLP